MSITPDPSPKPPLPNIGGTFLDGLITGLLLNAGAFCLGIIIVIGVPLILFIGVTQAFWMWPLWMDYRKAGHAEEAKGLVAAAAVTFLLNSACWGAFSFG